MERKIAVLLAFAAIATIGRASFLFHRAGGGRLPQAGIVDAAGAYFPKGTDFPLTNELEAQEQAEVDRGASIR